MESLGMELNDLITKVDLIVIGDALEAIALRSVLESFGADVRCHFVGNVKKLVTLLNGNESLHKIVILSCHGDEKGMCLPELASELEKTMPYHHILTASNCDEFLKLEGQLIINTGCCLGKDDFAQSFIQNGAIAYIGLKTYEEGSATTFFVMSLLYFYICKKLSLPDAFIKAQSIDNIEVFLKQENK